MVFMKCPGQDLSRKKIEEIVCNLPCPFCGAEVEFFFDDKSRECTSCGTKVTKSDIQILKDFGCADWCKIAAIYNAKNSDLSAKWRVSDFIQKNRSAIR